MIGVIFVFAKYSTAAHPLPHQCLVNMITCIFKRKQHGICPLQTKIICILKLLSSSQELHFNFAVSFIQEKNSVVVVSLDLGGI